MLCEICVFADFDPGAFGIRVGEIVPLVSVEVTLLEPFWKKLQFDINMALSWGVLIKWYSSLRKVKGSLAPWILELLFLLVAMAAICRIPNLASAKRHLSKLSLLTWRRLWEIYLYAIQWRHIFTLPMQLWQLWLLLAILYHLFIKVIMSRSLGRPRRIDKKGGSVIVGIGYKRLIPQLSFVGCKFTIAFGHSSFTRVLRNIDKLHRNNTSTCEYRFNSPQEGFFAQSLNRAI